VLRKKSLILLLVALTACGEPLLDADFSGAAGPLAGHGGWIGRDPAIQRDGKGSAFSNSNYGLKRLRDAGREDIFFILRLDRPVFF
jgi:hypothetical protein